MCKYRMMNNSVNTVKYLLLDLNSFFASCEQQDRPEWRGKPLAVVPMITDNTSVLASSVEAKKFGIKTGTSVGDAKKLCPKIILVKADHRRYTKYHHQIVKAVEEICPVEKVLSIDEMVCELIGRETVEEEALRIAKKIKEHIKMTVGENLTSSIGLGPNILISKIASDMMKPDGLVSITQEKILETLGQLPIEVISGIGANMKKYLNTRGYYKFHQLYELPSPQMKSLWCGLVGLRMSQEINGFDVGRPETKSKSLSHQHVLPPNLRNSDGAYEILIKLLSKAASRLRKSEQKCKHLGIYIKEMSGVRHEESISFQETNDSFFLIEQLKKKYTKLKIVKPIKVAVYLSDFTVGNEVQLSLFADPKSQKLGFVMDLVNDRYGANTLVSAGFLETRSEAKAKIAFHHIPKEDDEFD